MFKAPFPLPKYVLAPAGQTCICGKEIPAGTPSFHFSHCDVYFCDEHSVSAQRRWQKFIKSFLKEKLKSGKVSTRRSFYPRKRKK